MRTLSLLAAALAASALVLPASAQESRADAIYQMAYGAYRAGDMLDARSLALQAGEAGSVRAKALAGHLLERGLGGGEDQAQARALYEEAAAAGDGDALFALGVMAREGRAGLTIAEAESYFAQAADHGRKDGRVEQAMLYLEGAGIEADPAKAREILEQAAREGSVPAQRMLGLILLEEGQSAEAETWLVTAAEAGDGEAAYAIGVSYSTGDVLPQDDAKAARYLRIAANAGNPAAAADYGLMVYQGRGVTQSAEEAASWFRRSAEAGDQEGRTLYAIALAKGDGVERNLEQAYYWVLRASALGASPALNYEVDRFKLITALEQALPKETQTRIQTQVAALPAEGGAGVFAR